MARLIGVRRVPVLSSAGGIYTIDQAAKFKRDGLWPYLDRYFENTSLLIHCDGANNSTSLIDYSLNNLELTCNGTAVISTDQSKFGASSLYFNGSGYVQTQISDVFNFGTNDLTIEFFAYPKTDVSTYPAFVGNNLNGWSSQAWVFMKYATKYTFWHYDYNASVPLLTSTTNVSNDEWVVLAVVRNVNTWYLFVNGIIEATQTWSGSVIAVPWFINIGVGNGGYGASAFNGYIDEMRITKGVARYVSNYTPTYLYN